MIDIDALIKKYFARVWIGGEPEEEETIRSALLECERLTREECVADIKRAFQIGQTYWQQADSESYRQNAKASETMAKFEELLNSAAIRGMK